MKWGELTWLLKLYGCFRTQNLSDGKMESLTFPDNVKLPMRGEETGRSQLNSCSEEKKKTAGEGLRCMAGSARM